jgi:multicomponent Na+:H+ antiporter subunit G
MLLSEAIALALMLPGAALFLAGTVGMLRFPDAVSRLHALTKADGLGLVLIALGAAVAAGSAGVALRLLLICALVALSGALGAHLIARFVRGEEEER